MGAVSKADICAAAKSNLFDHLVGSRKSVGGKTGYAPFSTREHIQDKPQNRFVKTTPIPHSDQCAGIQRRLPDVIFDWDTLSKRETMSKTAVISAAVAIVLGSAATALAGPGGHGGGGAGGGGGGGMRGGGHGGGMGAMGGGSAAHGPMGGPGPAAMGPGFAASRAGPGPMTNAPVFNRAAPMNSRGMVTSPTGGNWANNNWHHGDHDHHHFHNRNFFAFGFGGPIYDYAYDSCWSYVPTPYGWQYVYVCGDYYGY